MSAEHTILPQRLEIPQDSMALVKGRKLSDMLCADCHNKDLGGKEFFNQEPIGAIYTPNITPTGIVKDYSDVDWVRAIRHGASPQGKGLFIMPSKDFSNLNERDLGSLIAYMKSVPSINRESGTNDFKPVGKFLLALGAFGEAISAEVIDHEAPIPPTEPLEGIELGAYMVNITGCSGCHGKDFKGAPSPDPESPEGPDLTSTGVAGQWSLEEFKTLIATGVRPNGVAVNPKFMPISILKGMDENEQEALFEYLKTLP